MKIFYGFDSLNSFVRPVVTIGSYDGVHAGHRELLARIVDMAHECGGESVVITFSPHPRVVLSGGTDHVQLLNTLQEKEFLLNQVGIDNLIIAPFTEEFSRVSGYDFVHDFLVKRVGVSTLVVGYNHHFGHNKEGNFDFLAHLKNKFGFEIHELQQQTIERNKVSSTVIRHLIEQGKMTEAARFLAHPYFILAPIARGGDVTINEPQKLLPPTGRYAVTINGQAYTVTIDDFQRVKVENYRSETEDEFMINFV